LRGSPRIKKQLQKRFIREIREDPWPALDSYFQSTMSVESIRRFCLSFPHATENLQWGDDLCFKVGGKIFALLSLSSVPPKLMFKCTPEKFVELVEQEDIVPAPYVGRYKWVSFERLDALPWGEAKDLIEQSYEMVAAKARITKANAVRPKATKRKPGARRAEK
jgi:predicted DNA-binding protein (MmcQ/YjbR family)